MHKKIISALAMIALMANGLSALTWQEVKNTTSAMPSGITNAITSPQNNICTATLLATLTLASADQIILNYGNKKSNKALKASEEKTDAPKSWLKNPLKTARHSRLAKLSKAALTLSSTALVAAYGFEGYQLWNQLNSTTHDANQAARASDYTACQINTIAVNASNASQKASYTARQIDAIAQNAFNAATNSNYAANCWQANVSQDEHESNQGDEGDASLADPSPQDPLPIQSKSEDLP